MQTPCKFNFLYSKHFETYIYCREKRKGTLTIDDGDPITDVSEQGATQLDTDGHLWLGKGTLNIYTIVGNKDLNNRGRASVSKSEEHTDRAKTNIPRCLKQNLS